MSGKGAADQEAEDEDNAADYLEDQDDVVAVISRMAANWGVFNISVGVHNHVR
jgi:hypothetical protein